MGSNRSATAAKVAPFGSGVRLAGGAALVLAACASAGDPKPEIDAPGTTGDGSMGGARQCASGAFATNIPATGQITCAPIEAETRAAIDASCSVYLGWRDNCDGCALPPLKWGRAGATCMNGAGGDNTCTKPALGGTAVDLFGLNFDGDVDGNDKLYGTLHCSVPEPMVDVGPCPAGQFISGVYGSSWTCSSVADVVVEYVRTSCQLYMGWRDSCNGCTTAPVKWGRVGDGGCTNGAGADNTCSAATLGTETLTLFGLNPDGNVNDDDKFYFGLHCAPAAAAMGVATATCPVGQFVTGTNTDGSFNCANIAPAVADFFTQRCSIYVGASDGCNGCVTPPAKWGTAKVGGCMNGVGANNTCGKFPLVQPTDMFGLNTDGDVDGNDTMYVGFRCD